MDRRKALTLLGAAGATMLALRSHARASSAASPESRVPGCVVTPEQTEGPYFIDERLNRSDIRVEPGDGSVKAGVPLTLALRVHAIGDSGCVPLAGAIVDIWHCDAAGAYSDVADPGFNTKGKKFLRGYRVTDASGIARFTTIYPGWYRGRTVHIHFKIRGKASSGRTYEFTSQLYFDDSLTDRVHAREPYASRGPRTLRNEGDGIFRDGGRQLMLPVVERGNGYDGTIDVAVRMA